METPGKLSKTLLAYLAGIMDGDGSITIIRQHPNGIAATTFTERISVGQTSPEAVYLFPLLGHGTIVIRKRGENWRPMYEWTATSKQAAACIKLLRPYLRVKARQADLLLALRASKDRPRKEIRTHRVGRWWAVAPEIFEERLNLLKEIQSLNDLRSRVD